MTSDTAFCKSGDGLIHLQSTSNPEYTLCGDAFDSDDVSPGAGWSDVRPQPVTCLRCVKQILAARGVRVARS